ncbi:hypothetical protein E2C01_079939 [Portunus trituberculatus]|uniref:Uncharacterized protein n=1 Tax=Portunus trituberculatus TaxID=210409 RepID=A0A5B7IU41_PORTR|nr:hypothetical protein [Portunus trituberculatus]
MPHQLLVISILVTDVTVVALPITDIAVERTPRNSFYLDRHHSDPQNARGTSALGDPEEGLEK